MSIRRLRGEMERITFRLSAEDRLEAERLAKNLPGRALSDYIRQALVEKNARERGCGGEDLRP